MKTKQIKKIAVTAAVIVAVCAVFALLYFGLSQLLRLDRGMVVAEYDGKKVYESDVQDIVNYQLILQTNETTTEEDLRRIMIEAVQTYVNYIVMEQDLAEMGIEIDQDEFKKNLKEAKEDVKKTYGSMKKWCDLYRVSNDFYEEEFRRYEIANLYYMYAKDTIKVTEDEAKEYYRLNALTQFTVPAGYYWTSIIRPVLDFTDTAELAAAKAEAEDYLAKIQNGTMTFDEVSAELKKKYTYENGYQGANFSGEDFTSMDAMVEIKDKDTLNQMIAEFDKHYKDRDLNADKNSEAYGNYMNYVASVFKANVFYALQNSELGQVYGEVLGSFAGYHIIRLDSIESTNEFVPFEEVEDKIVANIYSEKIEKSFLDYTKDLTEKYDIIFYV